MKMVAISKSKDSRSSSWLQLDPANCKWKFLQHLYAFESDSYPNLFLYEIAVQEFRFIIGYSVTVPANNCGKTLESSYDPLLKDNRWESAFLHKN